MKYCYFTLVTSVLSETGNKKVGVVKGTSSAQTQFTSSGFGRLNAWGEDEEMTYGKEAEDDPHYVYYQGQHSLTYQNAQAAREAHLRLLGQHKGASL